MYKTASFLVTLILIAAGTSSCRSVTFHGKVAVRGSEPHTYLSLLSADKGEAALVGPLRDEIEANYQGRYIKVEGRVVKKAAGPGFPAELEVIRILEVRSRPF